MFLVACLRWWLACGCPDLLLRWWLALRAPQSGPFAVRSLPLRRQSDPVRHPWLIAHSCSLSWLVVCSSVVRKSCASMSFPRGDALRKLASSARDACWPPGTRAGVHPLQRFSSFGTLDDATLAAASFCVLPAAGEASRRTLLSQLRGSVAGAPGVPSGVVSGLAVKGCRTVPPRRTSSTSPLVLQLLARLLHVDPVDGECTPRTAHLPVPAFAPAASSMATVEAMDPDGGAQAADVSDHANVPDHENEDPNTNASLAGAAAATPRQVRERARRRVRQHAFWRDIWVLFGLPFLSPLCADHQCSSSDAHSAS